MSDKSTLRMKYPFIDIDIVLITTFLVLQDECYKLEDIHTSIPNFVI